MRCESSWASSILGLCSAIESATRGLLAAALQLNPIRRESAIQFSLSMRDLIAGIQALEVREPPEAIMLCIRRQLAEQQTPGHVYKTVQDAEPRSILSRQTPVREHHGHPLHAHRSQPHGKPSASLPPKLHRQSRASGSFDWELRGGYQETLVRAHLVLQCCTACP